MSSKLSFLATCPVGLGSVLTAELAALGAGDVRETPAGVHFTGSLAVAYRACLWSRLANRILLRVSDTVVAVLMMFTRVHVRSDGLSICR